MNLAPGASLPQPLVIAVLLSQQVSIPFLFKVGPSSAVRRHCASAHSPVDGYFLTTARKAAAHIYLLEPLLSVLRGMYPEVKLLGPG